MNPITRFSEWNYQPNAGDKILLGLFMFSVSLFVVMFLWALFTYKEARAKEIEDPTIDPFQFDDVLQSN